MDLMHVKYLLAVSFIGLVYMVLGGVIFHYIEKDDEDDEDDEEKVRQEAKERNLRWLSE